MLLIISEDKRLIISCPIEAESSYIISKGNIFQGTGTDGVWNRYEHYFNVPKVVTLKFVSEIILWAENSRNAVEVK